MFYKANNTYTQWHHVIPKRLGGTDDPSNLIELETLDHAQRHKELWAIYGQQADFIAWKALSGQIGSEEARVMAHQTPESRAKMSVAKMGNRIRLGMKNTLEHNAKNSDAHKGIPKSPFTPEHCLAISVAAKGKPKSPEHCAAMSVAAKKAWIKRKHVL